MAQKLLNTQESVYIDLEDPRDTQKLEDPSYYFDQNDDRLIIIDEVQRRPDLLIGVEIDLLLSFGDELMAIEIKRSSAPSLSKGFHIACEDIKPTSKWVVYLGDDEYKIPSDITVLPLANLMKKLIAILR